MEGSVLIRSCWVCIGLASLLWLMACANPALTLLPEDAVILAFGDSLTVGVGAGPDEDYPSVLAELSGRKLINEGISGETTAEGLARFEETLSEHQPDLVILLEGGNDILRNLPADQTKSNLLQMVSIAQAQQVPIVLIAVPEKKLLSATAPWYPEIAEEMGISVEETLISSLLRQAEYKADSVHFNAAGYRKMAEGIFDWLESEGAF